MTKFSSQCMTRGMSRPSCHLHWRGHLASMTSSDPLTTKSQDGACSSYCRHKKLTTQTEKSIAQGYLLSKWQNWDLNLGLWFCRYQSCEFGKEVDQTSSYGGNLLWWAHHKENRVDYGHLGWTDAPKGATQDRWMPKAYYLTPNHCH
jgi:hypothetical protein